MPDSFHYVWCVHCGEKAVNEFECRHCGLDPMKDDDGCGCEYCKEEREDEND